MLEAARKGSRTLTFLTIISSEPPSSREKGEAGENQLQAHNPLFHARCVSEWFGF